MGLYSGFGMSVLFFLSLMLLYSNKNNLLSILIGLELMTFLVICMMFYFMQFIYHSMSYYIVLFCFAASGAALGLSLLVSYVRFSGSDLIKASIYWSKFVS